LYEEGNITFSYQQGTAISYFSFDFFHFHPNRRQIQLEGMLDEQEKKEAKAENQSVRQEETPCDSSKIDFPEGNGRMIIISVLSALQKNEKIMVAA
jgi:hypothetical protein